jgi:predicted transcriptional regulator of viral defense system
MHNITILKRLGYILEVSGLLDEYRGIFDGIRLSKGYSILDPLSPKLGKYNEKWSLLINREIKSERWMY